jgi:hypothetical protein
MTHELRSYGRQLAKDMESLWSMNDILREDLHTLLDVFNDDRSNQVLRRSLVRASWAYVEGLVFGVKRMTLTAVDLGAVEVTRKERRFLTEERFDVSVDGEVNVRGNREGAVENIKRTFKLAAKYFALNWVPQFDESDLERISTSIQLRNRIVHPQSAAGLVIADAELEGHNDAFEWFSTMFKEFFEDVLVCHGG